MCQEEEKKKFHADLITTTGEEGKIFAPIKTEKSSKDSLKGKFSTRGRKGRICTK